MAPRPCLRCGRLIPSGSYCRAHRPGRDRQRGYAWADLRQRVLEVHGHRCVCCGATGELEIHHIDGDYRNNAMSNLEPRCVPCHPREGRPPG
jgi:hypothetical protein